MSDQTLLLKNADVLCTMAGPDGCENNAKEEIKNGGLFARNGIIETVAESNSLPQTADTIIDMNENRESNVVETLKKTPDNFIDIVITSPPYNMNWRIHGTDDKVDPGRYGSRQVTPEISTKYVNDKGEVTFADNMPWEEYNAFHSRVLSELLRVSDLVFYNIQIVTGSKRSLFKMIGDFHTYLKDIIIWDKGYAEPAQQVKVMNSRYEMVLVFENDYPKSRMFRKRGQFRRGTLDDVWAIKRERSYDRANAAVFPQLLVAKILNNFSEADDIVYDPFMGTGTTALVARNMRRYFVGSEISKEYIQLSDKRLRDPLAFDNAIPADLDGSINKRSNYYREKLALGWGEAKINGYGRKHNRREYLKSISKGFENIL